MSKKDIGMTDRYKVSRLDERDLKEGDKHFGCKYYVLDIIHDRFAVPALEAYAAEADKDGFHDLAGDIYKLVRSRDDKILHDMDQAKMELAALRGERTDLVEKHLKESNATKFEIFELNEKLLEEKDKVEKEQSLATELMVERSQGKSIITELLGFLNTELGDEKYAKFSYEHVAFRAARNYINTLPDPTNG